MGIPIDRILDYVRDNVWSNIGREHLISKQDIRNIGTQYNVDYVQRHSNDAVSVQAWVKELQNSDYNPVLLYKVQGIEDVVFEKDDFVLSIQTKFQLEMLKKFGNFTVCIDSTHQTNHYGYPLNTLMVIDEYGEGIPVAYLLSNRETGDVLKVFFSAVKAQVGHLEPEVFMTDDAPQYFSSWQHVFGQSSRTKKLLCRWHLDKAWRKAVKEKIKETDMKPSVYHHLLVLLNEKDITLFNKKLQSFLSWLNQEEMAEFLQYFQVNYCNRISEWATHGRQHASVNTNMHVEAFHRLVKSVYFQQKQNRRVDCLLNVLLRLTRDKAFERLQKNEQSKVTYRQSEMNKRHVNAEKCIAGIKISSLSETCWSIKSQEGNTYSIQKEKPCPCPLKCFHCGVCTHMYSCTCLDNLLHCTACKHIHVLHMQLNVVTEHATNCHDHMQSGDLGTTSDTSEAFHLLDINHESISETALGVCKEVLETIPKVTNTSVLRSANKKLQAVLSLLRVNESPRHPMEPTKKYSPNAKYQKQLRFYKTRKTKSGMNSRWAKLSIDQEKDICAELLSQEITICANCHKEDEQSDEEAEHNNLDILYKM